jgi:hypothetical protein
MSPMDTPAMTRDPNDIVVMTRADSPAYAKAAVSIEQIVWRGLGYLDFSASFHDYYYRLLDHFADFQLCLVDRQRDYVVATANCAPLQLDRFGDWPDGGWDWMVQKAWTERDRAPNLLAGLAVSIPAVYRSKGYAAILIRAMKELAVARGLAGPLIAVRPTMKAKFPALPIADYANQTDEHGHSYDSWLRTHIACGGRLEGFCDHSMHVCEPVAFWEIWLNRQFPASGFYDVPDGISQVNIDLENNCGTYTEPNVWVSYI